MSTDSMVLHEDKPDESFLDHAKELIDGGIRAIMLPVGVPPAGLSPADAALDPFWALFASANVPITFHVGTEFPFLRGVWDAGVPAFEGAATLEINIQPYWGCTLHYAAENFLTTMVLGGVLERHPKLRLGAIEVGAHWVGPLAERMDVWADQFKGRLSSILSIKPSAYLNRQLRATPFHFEDVASYFERFPHLENVFSFSTDFPHSEGGRDTKNTFLANLANADDRIRRKFFRENGLFLLPE